MSAQTQELFTLLLDEQPGQTLIEKGLLHQIKQQHIYWGNGDKSVEKIARIEEIVKALNK